MKRQDESIFNAEPNTNHSSCHLNVLYIISVTLFFFFADVQRKIDTHKEMGEFYIIQPRLMSSRELNTTAVKISLHVAFSKIMA